MFQWQLLIIKVLFIATHSMSDIEDHRTQDNKEVSTEFATDNSEEDNTNNGNKQSNNNTQNWQEIWGCLMLVIQVCTFPHMALLSIAN